MLKPFCIALHDVLERCVVGPGEIAYVPEKWHHAVCNLDPHTVGAGYIEPLEGLPPLHLAAAEGHSKKVAAQLLLAQKEGVEAVSSRSAPHGARVPLHFAAHFGHVAVAKQLLAAKGNGRQFFCSI